MNKRILCLFYAAAMLMTLCGSGWAETRLVLWHCMSDTAGTVLDELIDDFNRGPGAEKGIFVEAVYQGAYTDAVSKMNNILSAGQTGALPDVMQLDATGKINYILSGVSYTADDAENDEQGFIRSDLLESAMSNWNYAGIQLGLPFATSTTLLYYNKTLLDAAGLNVPETLEDIAALYPFFAGSGLTIYAELPNTPSLCNWLGQLGSDVVDQRNGTEGTAGTLPCVENGTLVTFLKAWKQLFSSGALKNRAGSLDAFAAGQEVLLCASSSKLTGLLEKTEGRFEIGTAFFPRVDPEAADGSTASGSCLVMFDNGSDARKAAARQLVSYLTGAEAQAAIGIATGYIPCSTAAIEVEAYQAFLLDRPQYKTAYEQLLHTPAAMRSVTIGPSKDFYYAIQSAVADMLDYDLSPEETCEEMAEELTDLLTRYRLSNP